MNDIRNTFNHTNLFRYSYGINKCYALTSDSLEFCAPSNKKIISSSPYHYITKGNPKKRNKKGANNNE